MSAEKTTILEVENVTCGSCIRRIQSAISAEPGVSELDVQLAAGRKGKVTIRHDGTKSTSADLVDTLADSGFAGKIIRSD